MEVDISKKSFKFAVVSFLQKDLCRRCSRITQEH